MIGPLQLGVLMVEVTRRCPRRCAFCYVRPGTPDLPGAGPELPVADLARLALQITHVESCPRVQLSGGEPLLRPDLLDLVDRLREADLAVSLITDGAGLDASLSRQLAARDVGPVQPTLLAGRPAPHDRLRGPGAFATATRAIAEAAAAGLEVSVSYVITRENHAEARAVAELAFALGARTLALHRFCPAGTARARMDRLLPTAAQVREAASAAAEAGQALGLAIAAAITVPACVWPDPAAPPVPTGTCALMGADRTTVTLGPDGTVRSCSLSSRVHGTLLDPETPWPVLAQRLWQDELQPLRDTLPRLCQACDHAPRCRGGCRLSAPPGDPTGADALAPGWP